MYVIVEINGQQFKAEEGKKLFVHHIQGAEAGATVTLAADITGAGVVIADVWLNDEKAKMVVVDSLGDEFLDYVKDGMSITVKEDGTVEVA